MKKLFALLMALCLMLCACAYAEETKEINWSDFEEQAAQIEGQFCPIADLGVMMYIPSIFGTVELSDEQKAAGVISLLSTADGAGRISFTYQDLGDMDADTYLDELAKAGATDFEVAVLNGRNALSYDLVVNDVKTTNVVVEIEDAKMLTISFAPMDDEGFAELAGILTASIQNAQ
ncbi:MAG: hypothetical protein J5841_06155 [Clostridia bacterium]|nr:hypothetical protein [Clostridia bacterium]